MGQVGKPQEESEASGQLCFSYLFLQARKSTHIHKGFSFWIPKGRLRHSWERPSPDTGQACPRRPLPFHVQPSSRRRTRDGPGRVGVLGSQASQGPQKSSPAPEGKSRPRYLLSPVEGPKALGSHSGGRWGCHLPAWATDGGHWAPGRDTRSLGGPEQVIQHSGGFPICKVGRITSLVLLP